MHNLLTVMQGRGSVAAVLQNVNTEQKVEPKVVPPPVLKPVCSEPLATHAIFVVVLITIGSTACAQAGLFKIIL